MFVFVAESHWWFQEYYLDNGTAIRATDPSLVIVEEPHLECFCGESDHSEEDIDSRHINETDVEPYFEHHEDEHDHGNDFTNRLFMARLPFAKLYNEY